MIVAGRFYYECAVSTLSRLWAAPLVVHLDLARRIFGYSKKYPERGYAINPQELTIDADHEGVRMKYDAGNQYAYFSE